VSSDEVSNEHIVLGCSANKKCMGGAPAAPDCAAKAVSKDGKPLYGAAKDASIKKCEADAKK